MAWLLKKLPDQEPSRRLKVAFPSTASLGALSISQDATLYRIFLLKPNRWLLQRSGLASFSLPGSLGFSAGVLRRVCLGRASISE